MGEIEQLITTYNAVEAEQEARLWQLFQLIRERRGYRLVNFGQSEQWSNCWNMNEGHSYAFFKSRPYCLPITKYVLGEEPE
jgi:hypothetical protein